MSVMPAPPEPEGDLELLTEIDLQTCVDLPPAAELPPAAIEPVYQVSTFTPQFAQILLEKAKKPVPTTDTEVMSEFMCSPLAQIIPGNMENMGFGKNNGGRTLFYCYLCKTWCGGKQKSDQTHKSGHDHKEKTKREQTRRLKVEAKEELKRKADDLMQWMDCEDTKRMCKMLMDHVFSN
jgi:hypothetical protein